MSMNDDGCRRIDSGIVLCKNTTVYRYRLLVLGLYLIHPKSKHYNTRISLIQYYLPCDHSIKVKGHVIHIYHVFIPGTNLF